MTRNQLRMLACAGTVLLMPLAVWATGQGRMGQATELRSAPQGDATAVKPMEAGAAVEVLQRQGGWYQVKAGDAQGWVRMSSVQFAEPSAQTGGVQDALSFLSSGRATATEATASTGVRGLSETQLAQATPDVNAVARMEELAAKEADARQFAAQAPVQATNVQDLPKPVSK
jgi:hypothetical protein